MNIVTQQDKEKIEILNTKDDMIRKRDEVHFLRIEGIIHDVSVSQGVI